MNDTIDQNGTKPSDPEPAAPDLENDQPRWLLPSVLAGGSVVAILFLVVALAMWGLVRRRGRETAQVVSPSVAELLDAEQDPLPSSDSLYDNASPPSWERQPPHASTSEQGETIEGPTGKTPEPDGEIPKSQPDRASVAVGDRPGASANPPKSNARESDSEEPERTADVTPTSPIVESTRDDIAARKTKPQPAVDQETVTVTKGPSKSGGDTSQPDPDGDQPTDLPTSDNETRAKLPPPDAGILEHARLRFAEVAGERLQQATESEDKRSLAQSLMTEAATENNPAVQYVMLDQARQLAADSGDASLPFAVIEQIQQTYDADVLPMKADAVDRLVGTTQTAESRGELARLAADIADEASTGDQFEIAEKLAAAGLDLARGIKDRQQQRTVIEQLKQLEDDAAQWRGAEEAREKLAVAEGNAQANLTLGKYLCFVKRTWDAGLKHLAKGSDDALAKVATLDMQDLQDPKMLVRLADGWYDWGDDNHGQERIAAWSRAQGHYRSARPRSTGALRQKVDDRLKTLAEALGETYATPPAVVRLPWLDGPVGELQTFDGHTEHITALAVSPTGNLLASAAEDMTVRLWHLPTGKQVWQHSAETRNLNGIAITPDEQFVICNHDNHQLVVLNASTGKTMGNIPTSSRSPTDLAVAPDGQTLIWATRSRPPNILIWSLLHSRPLAHFGDGEYPSVLDVSTDGRFIATGDSRGVVRLWNAPQGTTTRQLSVHKDAVTDLDLSPDGTMVAAATYDKIAVVELQTSKVVVVFEQPSIQTVAFSTDGLRVVAGGFREEVLMWDLVTGQQLSSLRAERAFSDRHILRLAFLPDPRGLVTGATDGRIRLWRLPD